MKDLHSFKTVESYDEILENAKVFNGWFESEDQRLIRLLSNFRQWYYISELDDFAPSKFIGYKNMTPDLYLELNKKVLDGRETEPVLKKLFRYIEPHSDEWAVTMDQLVVKLNTYHKAPNKSAMISRKR